MENKGFSMLSAVAARKAAQARALLESQSQSQPATNPDASNHVASVPGPSSSKHTLEDVDLSPPRREKKKSRLQANQDTSSSQSPADGPSNTNGGPSRARNGGPGESYTDADMLRIIASLDAGRADEDIKVTKKKRMRKKKKNDLRYFQAKEKETLQELARLEEGNDSSASSSSDDDDDDAILSGDELEPDVLEPAPVPQPKSRARAWSPSRPLPPSDEEMEILSANSRPPSPTTIRAKSNSSLLSTFTPTATTLISLPSSAGSTARRCVIFLRPGEQMTLLGVASLTVVAGKISVGEVTLLPSLNARPIELFMPRCSPLSKIVALPLSSSPAEDIRTTTITPSLEIPSSVVNLVKNHDGAVIIVSELQTGIEGLGNICRTFEGTFDPPPGYRDSISLGLRGVQMLRTPHPHLDTLTIPPSWKTALSTLSPSSSAPKATTTPPIILIRGPKGSGKSTLAQYTLSTLLTTYKKVALLDTDPGQPLFPPASLISLHILSEPFFGPSFANLRVGEATKAHFVGGVSPRSGTGVWKECIEDLFNTWRLEHAFAPIDFDSESNSEEGGESGEGEGKIQEVVPLVINTHGWTKGYGALLSSFLQTLVEPTHIFEFRDSNTPLEAHSTHTPAPAPTAGKGQGPVIHYLDPSTSTILSSRYTSTDFRDISLLSYLHSLPSSSSFTNDAQPLVPRVRWQTQKSLSSIPPYEISLSPPPGTRGPIEGVYMLGPWADDIVPSELYTVLNCAIVALISTPPSASLPSTPPSSSSPSDVYIQRRPPPGASDSKCLGLALIRSVDPQSHTLHILTPVHPSSLGECRVLVKGEIELPIWGFLRLPSEARPTAGRPSEGRARAGDNERDNGDGGEWGEGGEVPFLEWRGVVGIGGEKRKLRRNLMRRGQM
ncbi:hypothetical protein SISSUDRAFT_1132727 [Sistotremastrum suecicum HHB10207 ss-3]|uniref:Polynucleotide 5'-hydroxyl-kinase GRC3 n=1 Tax=Sistotremastrum suecicum HHB10207 ss-3 TaxID=1314776 RepID=A0A165YEA7_9AGAM|nr:hypothetical protein SISSUDRAFT_1132727 [Sistotremastrum suecicum HHB10207 ss-3]